MKEHTEGKTAVLILETPEAARKRAEESFAEIQRLIHESDGAITPETVLQAIDLRRSIDHMLSHLPNLQQQVIRLYFGLEGDDDMSVEEISRVLSKQEKKCISGHRVRLLLRVGLSRLTKQYAADLLLDNGWESPLLNTSVFIAAAHVQ